MPKTPAQYNADQLANGTLRADHLPLLVAAFQDHNLLTVDGKAGPKTIACLDATLRTHTEAMAGVGDDLERAGRLAVVEANRMFERNIIDLPKTAAEIERCRGEIDRMIRTTAGLSWTWEPKYSGNFEWCGAFAATCWGVGGIFMDIRKSFFPSCYRLDRWARYANIEGAKNERPKEGELRKLLELDENSNTDDVIKFAPRAGDILLVGSVKSAYGQHICVVEEFDPDSGVFLTIEGNGTGMGPEGMSIHGVVRNRRTLGLKSGMPPTKYHPRRLIRPSPLDLAEVPA